jgi:hypothetical protein
MNLILALVPPLMLDPGGKHHALTRTKDVLLSAQHHAQEAGDDLKALLVGRCTWAGSRTPSGFARHSNTSRAPPVSRAVARNVIRSVVKGLLIV